MKYFLIVGEASGDLHGASLMRELKNTDPEAEFCFLGGDLMQNEGGRLVQHYKNMAFMGIVNVVLNLNKIAKNFELCTKAIKEFNPDVVILIDYPGFNLKIAKHVKKTSQTPVYCPKTLGVERVSNQDNKAVCRQNVRDIPVRDRIFCKARLQGGLRR